MKHLILHQRGAFLALGVICFFLTLLETPANDWPQLQHDAARTGRSQDEVAPPYRARWIWFGPAGTLRNRASEPNNPSWTNDLTSGVGKSYPMPSSVNFTLAGMMQPIVKAGLVFVASQEGTVYALRESDGATVWESKLPGGAIATGIAGDSAVVFGSLHGNVCAYEIASGQRLWTVETGKAITGALCLLDDRVYVANHSRTVWAIALASGKVIWKSQPLGGIVQGSVAATSGAVFLGAEDLKVYKLNAVDGQIAAVHQVYGQSFRLNWPVIHRDKVWVRTAPAWCVGSEGVNDPLLSQATDLPDEEAKYLAWLDGAATFGAWSAKNDWKNYFALNVSDLTEPFAIPCGPSEGCGQPPEPPVVDRQGNLISWWPTRFCSLTLRKGTFGTRYFIDLAGVDSTTGRRKPFNEGPPVDVWPMETDNLYALSTGGRYCYWRQRFRGTYAMDLEGRRHFPIQVEVRTRDGGTWNAPVMYVDTSAVRLPRTPSPPTQGRVGVTIANGRLYFTETYGVAAVEHAR
jgi:hypothetical protein